MLEDVIRHGFVEKVDNAFQLTDKGIDEKFRKALNNVVRFSYDNFEPEMVVFLFKTIMKDYQIRFNVRTDLDKELHKTFSERYTKYIA